MPNCQKILNDFLETGDPHPFAKYFLEYDYCNKKTELDEWTVKSILVVCQKAKLDIPYNFILQLYKNDYNLADFELSYIYPIDTKYLKSVTNCYTKKFSGGIGDFLRGSIHLYETLGVPVSLDFKQHPIGRFILTTCPKSPKYAIDLESKAEENRATANWSLHMKKTLNQIISTCTQPSISSFYHDVLIVPYYENNAKCFLQDYQLSNKCKEYFKDHIYFHKSIEQLYNNLNIPDYHVLHFRLGDRQSVTNLDQEISKLPDFIKQNKNYDKHEHDYDHYYSIATKYLKEQGCKNLIIMSDCNDLKSYITKINKNPNIHIVHHKSTHTSYAPSTLTLTNFKNTDIEDEKLMYTALDVKILSQSKNNTSYSVYNWGSGFVYWISKIFDVPCRINTL